MSHHVGMLLVVAPLATKLGLASAVGASAVAALGTGLRGVGRVHLDHGDTCDLRLVRQERVEVVEAPTARPIACVPAPGRNPSADARQILNGDPAAGASGGLDDLLGDPVVLVAAKACLFLGDTPQLLLGAPGPPALEPATLEVVLAADVLDGLAGVAAPVAVGGDVGDPEIHAEEVGDGDLGPVGDLDRDEHEPLARLGPDEVALPLGIADPLGLIAAPQERHDDPAGERHQADPIRALKAQGADVVGEGRVRPEDGPDRGVPTVRLDRPMDAEDGRLGS